MISTVAVDLRGHSNCISTRRHVSIVVVLLDVAAGVVLHTRFTSHPCHSSAIEAQLVLIFFHLEVDGPLLQLLQAHALIESMLDFVDHIVIRLVSLAIVVILVPHIGQVLHIWLELLEEDEAEGDECFRLNVLQVLGLLHRIDV